jgi:hypothetical protein
MKSMTILRATILTWGALSLLSSAALAQSQKSSKAANFESNPCFKASLELAQNPPSTKPSKEELERAQKLIQQKLKILKANASNPRLALQKQSGVELEECKELMSHSVNCTYSKCQELQKSLYQHFETMPEAEVQTAYDTMLAVYVSVGDPQQALSMTERLLVPELEKTGRKLSPAEVETLKRLEKNELDVEQNKKSKGQGYIDAVEIMKKGLAAHLNGAEKSALEESKRAAEAYIRGEIDEAELQVRSIEAHARAAGERITAEEREILLAEIRKNISKAKESQSKENK